MLKAIFLSFLTLQEVERWLVPPALKKTTGFPESDSAEEVDRKPSEMADKAVEPSSTGPPSEAGTQEAAKGPAGV